MRIAVKMAFGDRPVRYIPRPGVYAIITNTDGHLAVVEVKTKYFLIGGGLDINESDQDGLRREMMEETGRGILSSEFVGRVNQYVDSYDGHFNKIGSFYKVKLTQGNSIEHDPTHVFRWVTREEFQARGAHEAQIYAVENFINEND
ncbi:MAG: NUDIX domain-containing protein [Candidatus Magasanikbacteria bacterium]|nr:NUDIX domain-containing protein [Candidatus Magasanikbacteria bacterium]